MATASSTCLSRLSSEQRAKLVFEFVCKLNELPKGTKRCFRLSAANDRSVLLVRLQDKVFCLDAACYHHGGPLLHGDIEDLGGTTTLKCPWHAYHISVESGEGLYMGVDMVMSRNGRLEPSGSPKIKSKGVKQRTHFVEIRNQEDVFVADSSVLAGHNTLESDVYAFQAPPKSPQEPSEASQVPLHSSFSNKQHGVKAHT